MTTTTATEPLTAVRVLAADELQLLVDALATRGYRIVGPRVRDGAIAYEELLSADDLPIGWCDVQRPAEYRLERRDDDARFGYSVGPQSWKRQLLPPRVRLWQAHERGEDGFTVEEEPVDERPTAFFGVKACELAAIRIQDRVFAGGSFTDRDYVARRRAVFTVAVDCSDPSAVCFCGATGTGPAVADDHDLRLTEILEGTHRFLVRAGSEAGAAVLADLPNTAATDDDLAAAARVTETAQARLEGEPDLADVHNLLLGNLEHRRYDDVASRCLTCGNCTLVCPTCFCTTVEDASDLDGSRAERFRVWDTCFSVQYAEMHGGNTRPLPRSRYRQWLTHKFATWQDQFGSLGCVGCGRCIAWCPVGIDVREEITAIAEEDER